MMSFPTLRSSLAYGFTTKGEQETPKWTGVILSTIICVSTTWWLEIIPWTVSCVDLPLTFNHLARFAEIQEWLEAESPSAVIFSDLPCAWSSTSVTCSNPFTSVTEDMPEFSSGFSRLVAAAMQPDVSGFTLLLLAVFFVKVRSAPCKKDCLSFHMHFFVHLRGCGHCRIEWLGWKHEKQSFLSATIFALSEGVFFQKTGDLHNWCLSLQATQFGSCSTFFLEFELCWLDEAVEAKVL